METLLQQVLSIFILFLLLLLGFRLIVFAFQLLLRLLSFLLQGKGASHHQKRPVKRKQKEPLSVEQKGKLGEDMTFASLRQLPYYHKIYRNIIIPKGNSDTTEIDLIVITQYGIIVIENKNYSGYILGREVPILLFPEILLLQSNQAKQNPYPCSFKTFIFQWNI